MKFILGKKVEMTQKYREDGTAVPVTKIHVEPCTVVQVKVHARDGYSAVQVGIGKKKKLNKAQTGHFQGLEGGSKYLQEFRIEEAQEKDYKKGDLIAASVFEAGEKVKVSGMSKGKGFQGVVKRHRFKGSPKTHGHKDQLRMPGSIGAGGVQHVLKGKRMPGRMGNSQITQRNMEVIEVDSANNDIFIKGAVPGARNNIVWITA